MLTEINIDALVGPTHHFGGLGVGNLASQRHALQVSNPRAAALQGLDKAALVASFDIPQFLSLPPLRPRWDLLAALGLGEPGQLEWTEPGRGRTLPLQPGEDSSRLREQLEWAYQVEPRILSAAFSSAFMWMANSATVTPACDAQDNRYHFTPANLISSLHRATEAEERKRDLESLFRDLSHSVVHDPLPSMVDLRDEGAANHIRLTGQVDAAGFHLLVFGADDPPQAEMTRFFPRQTRAACRAIARRHRLDPQRTFFFHQHPQAVSAGVFHNDVIATGHENLLIHHQLAFLDGQAELERLSDAFSLAGGSELIRVEVTEHELSLDDAVRSYFFNSQLLTPGPAYGGTMPPRMILVSPESCAEIDSARSLIDRLLADESIPIDEVRYVALDQSMAGGGGPACLRLRVPLDSRALGQLSPRLRLDERLEERLREAMERLYPSQLQLRDFCDVECVRSLAEIPNRLEKLIGF